VQWGMYARNYRVKQVETTGSAAILTHINYAFANVSTESRCYEETRLGWGDSSADYLVGYSADQSVDGLPDDPSQKLKGHWNQLKKLKAIHPNLKVLISIGGFTWSGRFSDAALPQNREAFVKSCIDLFIKGNLPLWAYVSGGTPSAGAENGRAAGVFDGIDIDWEYPAAPGFPGDPKRNIPPNVYRPEDTQNFTALLAEFRRQLDELGAKTGQHYLLTIAAPAGEENYSKIELEKIHPYMGVPFYGRGWTGVPNVNDGLYQSADTMEPAPARFEAGIEDAKILAQLGYPSFRDPKTKAMWIFDGKTWWNYDDPEVIAAKMVYIKQKKLGGVMFWSLDGDDGTLIRAIRDGLK
jgi:chitinase